LEAAIGADHGENYLVARLSEVPMPQVLAFASTALAGVAGSGHFSLHKM
jgi:hypothetical protein